MTKPFWSFHTHSRYSAKDAMPGVPALVSTAAARGYPALGLTDHGNVSGTVQLYKAARKIGMEPLPGQEFYITGDRELKIQSNYHITVVAYSETGYRNLVRLNNLAARNFYYRPRIDLADLAEMAAHGYTAGLAVGTGCYFGLVQQTIKTRGSEAALRIVNSLAAWFPRVYVELHNHGVDHGNGVTDADFVNELLWIAEKSSLPYLIAADSHYLEPGQQYLHNALKTMVSWSDDPSEAAFPGGPYHLPDRDFLAGFFDADILDTACDNLDDLARAACVRLPELEQFHMKVPDVTYGGDPMAVLKKRVYAALKTAYPDGAPQQLLDRVSEELDVIEAGEIAGFLIFVAEVCDYMYEQKIWFHARGSASSSKVVHLLGITQAEPLEWGLLLDRFLSADRTRPPDIDLDVEHTRRDEVVRKIEQRFSVRQVGSHMQMGLQSDDQETESSKGSLLVQYFSTKRKSLPADAEKLTWDDVPGKDRKILYQLADMKLIAGPGTHAAGYIVAPDEAAVAELPLTWMTRQGGNGGFVTSYGKKDVEALGFLKLDLLGLKTLTAIRICCELVSPETPGEFWDAIPMKDKATFKRIGKGVTDGMFQLEGYAQARGCRQLKPKSVEDIALAQALFRPAGLKSGDTKLFLARREGEQLVPDRHPDIMAVTQNTMGIALYQEQVMSLCKVIGMTSAELTDTLDAVKASNAGTADAKVYLEQIKGHVHELATARGWSGADVDWLVDSLAGYAEYSFNKAHAAQYGTVAYKTGYLAEHHPLEFWTGMLIAYTGAKRGKISVEDLYLKAARRLGVQILPAHINSSEVGYSLDRDRQAIRKGLTSILKVGPVAAAELRKHAPYPTLSALGERVSTKVGGAKNLALNKPLTECGGQITALYENGAFEGLEP